MALYRDIAADLAERIDRGEFADSPYLPPEHELTQRYRVARGTIRNALRELARDGVLTSRRGAGWAVNANVRTHHFVELRSFAQWALANGFEPSGQVLRTDYRPASETEAALLEVPPRARLLRVLRLRGLDGRVVMLERTTYTPWISSVIESIDPNETSVVQVLESAHGITLTSGDHVLDAVAASTEDAALLKVRRSSPLLRVRRDTRGPDGRVVEFSDDRYVPGTVDFRVRNTVGDRDLIRSRPRVRAR